MSVEIDRVLRDIQELSIAVQDFIGRTIDLSFGYKTTPETNTFLMYLFLVLLVFVLMRIFRPSHGKVKATTKPRSRIGYDFGRYG